MEYEIIGGSFPVVECTLKAGESMITQSGSMAWMDPTITMETSTNGGLKKVVGRLFTNEHLFQNIYTATQDGSKISFGTSVPGAILAVKVEPGKSLVCQKSAFLASYGNVELSTFFNKKIGVGIFGGEGFIMQRITGDGIVFIEIDGSYKEFELQANQQLILSTGYLVSIDETCSMDVQSVGGLKNIILGGEGIFNTVITGPGKVVVQTMPLPKLANSIVPFLPQVVNTSNGSGNDAIDAGVSLFKMFTKK
ncbi:MAG: TIGR00266 family protein [Bacilli bacterium]|nr:TIGR00266 family protein [Bacilli bacterium]